VGYSLLSLAGIELFFCEFEEGFSSSPFFKGRRVEEIGPTSTPQKYFFN
jgi:hypothetical protein